MIAALKERYNGQMDFACAKRLLCAAAALSGRLATATASGASWRPMARR